MTPIEPHEVAPAEASKSRGTSRRHFLGGVGGTAALATLGTAFRSTAAAAATTSVDPAPSAGPAEAGESLVQPVAVTSVSGDVKNAAGLVKGGTATLTVKSGGPVPQIVLDYGQIVGGQPKFVVSSVRGDVTLKAIYSQSLPYLLPAGDGPGPGTPSTDDAAEGNVSFFGAPAGANLSRVEVYPVTTPGTILGPLLQAGERFQAMEVTGSGSVQLSVAGLLPSFRLDTPGDPSAGAFTCSDTMLNQIWVDGVHTANACCVPVGSVTPLWVPTTSGMKVYGCGYTGYWPGGQWTDYTVNFQAQILENELAWLVRGLATTRGGGGITFVLCAGDDTLPISTPGTLRVYNLGTLALIDTVKLPFTPVTGKWYSISTVVSGTSVTVTIDSTQVYSNGSVTGMNKAGWAGFTNAQGAVSLIRNLLVTGSSGSNLLSQPLTNHQSTAKFIDACIAGTNIYPSIMDGATRDREIWSGDIGITHQTILYGSYDNQYITGSAQVLALYQASNGFVPNAIPAQANGPNYTGPGATAGYGGGAQDYNLAWAHFIYSYWLHTNDTKWLQKIYANYATLLAALLAARASNGLLAGGGPLSTPMSTNMHFYGVLNQGTSIASAIGDSGSASTWSSAAATLRAAINSQLFNTSAGMYGSSPTQLSVIDQIGNGYALLFGVPDSSINTQKLTTNLTTALAGPLGPCASSSAAPNGNVGPYTTGWEVLGRLEVGDTSGALKIIRDVWGAMLRDNPYYSGAHWEYISQTSIPGLNSGTSLAHGWSSGATPALSKYVLGGRPLTAGFATWLVEPQPGDLQWARGRVPTPHGPLAIDWRTNANGASGLTVSVSVPNSTSGYVGIPTTANTAAVDGAKSSAVNVPGYTARPGYSYFGPLKHGIHHVVTS